MPLTPQQLALRLAKHIEVTSFDPNDPSNTSTTQRGLQPGDTAELAACINAALQEIWDAAPTALRLARFGVDLRAPVSVMLDVQNGSAAIGSFGGYESWMEGCRIQIGGTEVMNELVDGSTLFLPYSGPTATSVSATVYHDCVIPDAGAISVIDPISVVDYGVLRSMGSLVDFDALRQCDPSACGVPEVYWLDTHAFSDPPMIGLRLRLFPAPDQALQLTYGARMNLLFVTEADLESTTPVRPFQIPGGWEESVLLPLALQRLSLHPDFKSENLKTELPRQTEAAYRILRGALPRRSATTVQTAFR